MVHLSIDVLGSLQVSIADTPITRLESDKVCALLAYLAVESDRPHRRETLVGLLWPESPEEAARHNLRQALFNLRSALGDHIADPPYLIVTRNAIQFNRDSDYSLDLDQFNRYFLSCEGSLSQSDKFTPAQITPLEDMVQLYRGEFLHQLNLDDSVEFGQWTLVQRENAHQRILEALDCLTSYYLLHNDFNAARRYASRQLELDPWREEAHRQMMQVLALDGERSAALAQYDTCKRVLAEELDVEPSVETHELYEQIRSGAIRPISPEPVVTVKPVKNLPIQLTPFIGREEELEQLEQLITNPECRCINLLGPGGIGKTRLAVRAAEDQLGQFSDGAAFVQLASVGSMNGVIPAIANAINIAFYGSEEPEVQLLGYLSNKHMLLILDNVEHLLVEDASQESITHLVVEILQNAPKIKLLVTSREALSLQEEWLFEVQGLAFPETAQTTGIDRFDAVALFVLRAKRAFSQFTLNQMNRVEIAQICRLVEGMPLAIELAATWMRSLSPSEIVAEIKGNADFLSAQVHDMPERHRSMRVVFDHSWRMLSTQEQQVLSILSVFRGGFQRQAAEQVAGATLSILSTLVNRTLLRRTAGGRYDLHELIHQYCADQLAANPEAKDAARKRHTDYYLTLAEMANQELQARNQLEWLSRLEQEHDNLRVALEWTLASCGGGKDSELPVRLASALRWFWRMRGHFHEGCDWLNEALRCCPGVRTVARASALAGYSLLINGLGDLEAARLPAEESVAIYRELGIERGLAEALMIEGLTLLWQGEAVLGEHQTREALAIYRKTGDRWGEAQALYRLGSYLADYGGVPEGQTMLEESARILESFDEKYLYTSVLVALGIVDMKLGNYTVARLRFENGLIASREIKHPWGIADVLTNLGCLVRIQGDFAIAQTYFEEALKVYRERGRNVWEIDVLCAMTENAIVQGDFSSARLHLQAAESVIGTSENILLQVLLGYFRGLLAYYEGDLETASTRLSDIVSRAQKGHFKPDLARSLLALGLVRLKQGKTELACELMQQSLGVYQEIGYKLGIAVVFEALAAACLSKKEADKAVELFSIAVTMRQTMGAPLPPVDHPAYNTAITSLREAYGKKAFNDLWERSASRPYDEIVEEVLKSG